MYSKSFVHTGHIQPSGVWMKPQPPAHGLWLLSCYKGRAEGRQRPDGLCVHTVYPTAVHGAMGAFPHILDMEDCVPAMGHPDYAAGGGE